jgi:hypothetical protein
VAEAQVEKLRKIEGVITARLIART